MATEEVQSDLEKLHDLIGEYIATQAHEWFHAKHPGLRLEWEIKLDTKPSFTKEEIENVMRREMRGEEQNNG